MKSFRKDSALGTKQRDLQAFVGDAAGSMPVLNGDLTDCEHLVNAVDRDSTSDYNSLTVLEIYGHRRRHTLDIYVSLAEELMEALDRKKKGPPHEDVSATMRGELAVLRLLEDEGRALTAGEISRLLRMTTSRIAAVLGALEKKGLIVRSADETDKRRVLVTLTKKGLSLGRRKKQNVINAISYAFAQIGEDDAREFVRLMKRVYDILPPPPPLSLDDEHEEEEGGIPRHER